MYCPMSLMLCVLTLAVPVSSGGESVASPPSSSRSTEKGCQGAQHKQPGMGGQAGSCGQPNPPCKSCKENEYYTDCGNCEKTCENYGKAIECSRPCKLGCFCKKGFVRNAEGRCVSPTQCPHRTTCKGQNEEYSDCGGYVKTCDNYKANICCPALRHKGCFCKQGYVRNSCNVCVCPSQCQSSRGDMCKNSGETYKNCSSSCSPTCPNRGTAAKPSGSPAAYVKGCTCLDGRWRSQDGHCVWPWHCF